MPYVLAFRYWLSILSPEEPFFWLSVEQCFPSESPEFLEDLRDESLINLSLLHRVDEGLYQIHQLLREFLNEKLNGSTYEDDVKHSYCRIMPAMATLIPEFPNREQITFFSLLVPHINESVTVLRDWLDNDCLNIPFHGLGNFYKAQGEFQQAISLLEQCLSLVQERLGEKHIRTAASLHNLSLLYFNVNCSDERARDFSNQALEIVRSLEAEKTEKDVRASELEAAILNGLAQIYCSQKSFEKAETLYQQALEILENWEQRENYLEKNIYADDSVGLKGVCLDNLSSLYREQGRYEEAEAFGQKGFAAHETETWR